ncbi:hypothetical protein MAHJHV28_47330 [Mycobacterium avium subsp. hominissuis]
MSSSSRTLFRYYASKNAIPWGDFGTHLARLRELLDNVESRVPLADALRTALLAFNTFDESETARHRQRIAQRYPGFDVVQQLA